MPARGRRQIRHASRMPQQVRTFQVDEIRHCAQHLVQFGSAQDVVTIGRLGERRRPCVMFEDTRRDGVDVVDEHLHHTRTELGSASRTSDSDRLRWPTETHIDLATSASCTICISTGISSPRTPVGSPAPSQRSKVKVSIPLTRGSSPTRSERTLADPQWDRMSSDTCRAP